MGALRLTSSYVATSPVPDRYPGCLLFHRRVGTFAQHEAEPVWWTTNMPGSLEFQRTERDGISSLDGPPTWPRCRRATYSAQRRLRRARRSIRL